MEDIGGGENINPGSRRVDVHSARGKIGGWPKEFVWKHSTVRNDQIVIVIAAFGHNVAQGQLRQRHRGVAVPPNGLCNADSELRLVLSDKGHDQCIVRLESYIGRLVPRPDLPSHGTHVHQGYVIEADTSISAGGGEVIH